ncbi:glucuronyl hydrolase [bacterium]|nr:glucuronyl hydrolase [bacterium]
MAEIQAAFDLASLRPRLHKVMDFAADQLAKLTTNHPDFFPIYTRNGRWKHDGSLWTDWCAGFLGGQLWLLEEYSGESHWRELAEHYSLLLEYKQHDRDVHDLGFIFLNTYRPWYRRTGAKRLNNVLITAGRTLAMRFMENGQYLRSFVAPESLFIDIMMNVPIIFYAAEESGDQALYDKAVRHCRTTESTLVREDGSTAHEGIFDLKTGAFLRQTTHQGLNGESRWTRGLAWSLYGYAQVYQFTGDIQDLAVARRNADCFLNNLDDSWIAPWDFDAAAKHDRMPDTSASAIAASGLFTLADIIDEHDLTTALKYRRSALKMLEALTADGFMGWSSPGWEGILKRGVYHIHKKLGVDESVMWGEYFFLEAVMKALRIRENVREI